MRISTPTLHNPRVRFGLAGLCLIFFNACEATPPPGGSPSTTLPRPVLPQEVEQVEALNPQPGASALSSAIAPSERPPWSGPFLGVTRSSAGIYSEPSFAKNKKIGYAQEGAKLPVHPEKIANDSCSEGWFKLVDGGFVCANHGTTKLDDPRIKFGPTQPDIESVLPYRYARNVKNGTPLYKSVPSKEQLKQYEPELFPSEAAKSNSESAPKVEPKPVIDEATRRAQEDQQRRMAALREARRAMLGESAEPAPAAEAAKPAEPAKPKPAEGNAANGEDAGAEKPKTWWQEDDPELHKLSLTDLSADSDDVLASRLVKGFYVAVDKVFDWNKRNWLKSTRGFVTPADNFHFAAGSDFKGIELGADVKLPIGFAFGSSTTKPTYTLDADGKTLKAAGTVKRFSAVALSGDELTIGGKVYVKAVDERWMRKSDLRITAPEPPPPEVGPEEAWVDVNLSTQTLVAFRGTVPFYATLISSGKKNSDPEKDHSTPLGKWRVREKHITATMDGDGSVAGDLPYSIEGVPYVMYFHKAYALHGAFWHSNYGSQMSHGCVNLAPLDAKFLFFHTNPPVAEGWHGAWASAEQQGSFVVIHD
jgi:hypothetical protein